MKHSDFVEITYAEFRDTRSKLITPAIKARIELERALARVEEKDDELSWPPTKDDAIVRVPSDQWKFIQAAIDILPGLLQYAPERKQE